VHFCDLGVCNCTAEVVSSNLIISTTYYRRLIGDQRNSPRGNLDFNATSGLRQGKSAGAIVRPLQDGSACGDDRA